MKYYYLINGKIMSANEKMPEKEIHKHFWGIDLQPCEISESELDKLIHNINDYEGFDTPIEVTDIVYVNYDSKNDIDVIEFKEQPKQVELHTCKYCGAETSQSDDECYAKPKQVEEIEAVEFAEWCAINLWIYKNYDDIWINYGGIDLRKLKSKQLYEIFKNQK